MCKENKSFWSVKHGGKTNNVIRICFGFNACIFKHVYLTLWLTDPLFSYFTLNMLLYEVSKYLFLLRVWFTFFSTPNKRFYFGIWLLFTSLKFCWGQSLDSRWPIHVWNSCVMPPEPLFQEWFNLSLFGLDDIILKYAHALRWFNIQVVKPDLIYNEDLTNWRNLRSCA